MSHRTFKIDHPHMRGDDVASWQETLNKEFRLWGVHHNVLKVDRDYGLATRSASSIALKYMGIAQDEMEHGVTPDLRIKVRNRQMTSEEHKRLRERTEARRAWVREQNGEGVALPVSKIIEDSWDFRPGHDGIDLICPPCAGIYAICQGVVVRADNSGWWGLGNPGGAVGARGDGIVILRASVSLGPIKRGWNICYGHAEHARVSEGDHVKAGERLGQAGFANAWHVHWMINDNNDTRGVGNINPRETLNYLKRNS